MATILKCPECSSFLLLRAETASPLDGQRRRTCLECGANVQPPRPRWAYIPFFVLACLFTPVFIVLGVLATWYGAYRYMALPWLGAFACIRAAMLMWRSFRATTASRFDTTTYPSQSVSLEKFSVNGSDIKNPAARKDWAAPLAELVAEVIRLAGEHLVGAGRLCHIEVRVACREDRQEYSIRYRGRADHKVLGRFESELARLSAVKVSPGEVRLEFWFRIG